MKLCIDCKHIRLGNHLNEVDKLNFSTCHKYSTIDLVSGGYKYQSYCSTQRDNYGETYTKNCGPEARGFEPKDQEINP